MKKRILLLIVILLVSGTSACSEKDNFSPKRVYMIYMNGSDLETDYGAAGADLAEIVSANTNEEFAVYIYTGGTQKWHTEGISSENNELFEVRDNLLVKTAQFDDSNMGDADTLVEFAQNVHKREGNCEYNIILWNHGGNALTGFGLDEKHSGDSLLTEELARAFERISDELGIHFGFIAFDACLMANMETMTAIGEYCDYMVASEEVVPACGFDYKEFFKKQHKTSNKQDNAKLLAKSYFKTASSEYSSDFLSISVVDTDKLADVKEAFEQALCASDIGGGQIMMFGGKSDAEGYSDMADMLSIFEDNSSDEVQHLIDRVNEAVIYSVNGRNSFGACGISVYFPYYVQSEYKMELYARNSFSDLYTDILAGYKGPKREEAKKGISLEIDGKVYECAYCGESLFCKYYTAYALSEGESTLNYRIRKNILSDEVEITAVFVGVEGEYGRSEEKYLKYE